MQEQTGAVHEALSALPFNADDVIFSFERQRDAMRARLQGAAARSGDRTRAQGAPPATFRLPRQHGCGADRRIIL